MNVLLLVLATVMVGGAAAADGCCPYPGVNNAFPIANIPVDLFKCDEPLKLLCAVTELPVVMSTVGIAFNVSAPGPVAKSQVLGEMLTGMSMDIFCDKSPGLWKMQWGENRYENFICVRRVAGTQIYTGY